MDITFWFYSDFESNLYKAAHKIQKDGYKIVNCDRSDISDDWLLIAEKEISPSPENLESLFIILKTWLNKWELLLMDGKRESKWIEQNRLRVPLRSKPVPNPRGGFKKLTDEGAWNAERTTKYE
jgi:hypothetical protein